MKKKNNRKRTVNLHFPWSNGRIYWVCGNDGTTSYDRIDKAATLNEYAGQWSHWAFTKNTVTGNMKIYRNGQLWHSGSGKTKSMNIESFVLGANGSGTANFWHGKIKELRIFNQELSDSLIQSWMHRRINVSHPRFINLVAYYPFSEGSGNYASDYTGYSSTSMIPAPTGAIAQFNGNVKWRKTKGEH